MKTWVFFLFGLWMASTLAAPTCAPWEIPIRQHPHVEVWLHEQKNIKPGQQPTMRLIRKILEGNQ